MGWIQFVSEPGWWICRWKREANSLWAECGCGLCTRKGHEREMWEICERCTTPSTPKRLFFYLCSSTRTVLRRISPTWLWTLADKGALWNSSPTLRWFHTPPQPRCSRAGQEGPRPSWQSHLFWSHGWSCFVNTIVTLLRFDSRAQVFCCNWKQNVRARGDSEERLQCVTTESDSVSDCKAIPPELRQHDMAPHTHTHTG